MSNGVGLYYPHIEFHDVNWLKWALLFWDNGLRRILPPSAEPNDQRDVLQAIDAGAVIDTDCSPYVEAASRRFLDKLDLFVGYETENELLSSVAEARPGYDDTVQYDKVASWLADEMVGRKLARLGHRNRHQVLWVPRSVTASYMTLLAEEMSSKIGAPAITDRPLYAELAQRYISPTRGAPLITPDRQAVLQRLVVDFIDPSCLYGWSMVEILEFRRRHIDEIRLFREGIELAVARLTDSRDQNLFEDLLLETGKSLSRAISEHQKSIVRAGFSVITKVLTVSGLGVLGEGVHVGPRPELMFLGFALVTSFIAVDGALEYRAKRRQSPYQYLLSLQEQFPR